MNRSHKTYVAVFLIVSLALLTVRCGDAEPAPAPATPTPLPAPTPALFPYTITDGNGNPFTFDKPPERIVGYDSAVVEILFAIGEGHRVVGTHDFLSSPPEAAAVARIGGAFNVNLEAIVALEPDLVSIFTDDFLDDFKRVGLRVLYQKTLNDDFTKIADIMRMWGRITGATARAEALAVDFEERVSRISDALAANPEGLSVFQYEGDLWTPGPDTLIHEVFELLKLKNIAYDVEGYAQLSPEIVVERDPQLVIASTGDTISDVPAFSEVSAVKGGRVHVPATDALMVAGPRFIEGVEALAAYVYPELFD